LDTRVPVTEIAFAHVKSSPHQREEQKEAEVAEVFTGMSVVL
jgi:hypothetical protein